MSAERFTLDANILFYSVDEDAGAKQERAIEILRHAPRQDCVLTLQSLGEFYAALTRKKPGARKLASDHVTDWLDIFPIVVASPQALAAALPFSDSGQLSFWDALLLTTARDAGCAVVLSEDMGDGARVAGVTVRDPFAGPELPGDIGKLLGISQSP